MLSVDLVTPSRKLLENVQTDSVKIPGARGELQILPGHADLLTLLNPGTVSLVQDGKERKYFVSHGFAEVRGDKVLVFGETVEESADIDRNRAQAAQKKAEQALLGVLTEPEFKKHQLKLERAIIRQHISS